MKKNGISGAAGRLLATAAAAASLAACASSADPHAMAVAPPPAAVNADKAFPQALMHAMCVRAVTGGEKTNPLWVSKVDNDGFKSALGASLDTAGLTAPASGCSYPIDVNLLGLSQPSMGFDMTVTSHVNYKVYNSGGEPYLLATIDAPFTATVGDAFLGVERLKKANEGSIRASIQMFFDKLKDSGRP
ncbi:MAG: hypothetical protein JOZ72_16115 [Alphaproteobacteria bacterium]|nr:hypothetical protein [Alphaproteobacteria bacterium]